VADEHRQRLDTIFVLPHLIRRRSGPIADMANVRRCPSRTPRSLPASWSMWSTTNNSRRRRAKDFAEAATSSGRSIITKFSTASTAAEGT
jgi:hypothetical protein